MIGKPKPEKKVKPPKRKHKTPRQLLEIKADNLVKTIVILRDKGCVCPPPEHGHSSILQPGHLITRGKESVKWDLRNVSCQCSNCNMRHVYHPQYYTQWFVRKFGAESYLQLCEDSGTLRKVSTAELVQLCETLEGIVDDLKKDPSFRPFYTQTELLAMPVKCNGGDSGKIA